MKKVIVNDKYNGKNLISFLLDTFDGLSLNNIYKAFRKKDIRINNIRINKNCLLRTDDEITIFISDQLLYKQFSIDIIYEDENILIVNKPCGIEVVRSF